MKLKKLARRKYSGNNCLRLKLIKCNKKIMM